MLAQVGLLTQLKDLTLQECHEITEEGYAEIAHLTSLQRLDLSGCGGNLTDECVVYLRGLIEMKILNLNHCNVSDVGLKYLSHLPLEELYLRCEITDDGLKHVGKMGSLRVLELSGNLQGPGFIHIQKLGELRMLHVHSYWLEDIALEHIAELPTLEELHVTNNHRITSDGIEKLNQLLTLKRLNLGHCIQLKDDGVEELVKLVGLEILNLESCSEITDVALDSISQLSKLRALNLRNCSKITDKGLYALSVLPELRTIGLSGCPLLSHRAVEKLRGRDRRVAVL